MMGMRIGEGAPWDLGRPIKGVSLKQIRQSLVKRLENVGYIMFYPLQHLETGYDGVMRLKQS